MDGGVWSKEQGGRERNGGRRGGLGDGMGGLERGGRFSLLMGNPGVPQPYKGERFVNRGGSCVAGRLSGSSCPTCTPAAPPNTCPFLLTLLQIFLNFIN